MVSSAGRATASNSASASTPSLSSTASKLIVAASVARDWRSAATVNSRSSSISSSSAVRRSSRPIPTSAAVGLLLTGLAATTPLVAGGDECALVDIDDTIIEVHGYTKQGSGYGYSGVRGLNALIATPTNQGAPVIVAQRLRKGSCGSPRGAKRLVTDALATAKKLRTSPADGKVLLRADSAFYGHGPVGAAVRAGAQVSVTVRLDPTVKATIATIPADAWQAIEYTDAIYDQTTGAWISTAEVAEIPFTAFAAQKKANQIPGRLVVRRIPDLNAHPGQATLFQTWRFHGFFTTSTLDTVTADKTHRGHTIIEQVHADLKNSALAHLPLLILSRRVGRAADLHRYVVDGVLDVA
jgi:hypothetical protein